MYTAENIILQKEYYFFGAHGELCRGTATRTFAYKQVEERDESGKVLKSVVQNIVYFTDAKQIDKEGKVIRSLEIERINASDVFDSFDVLFDESVKRHNRALSSYMNEIKTVEDLIEFPFNHQLNGNDADRAAQEAYIFKAMELLDVFSGKKPLSLKGFRQ